MRTTILQIVLVVSASIGLAHAQEDRFAKVEITTTALRGGLHMLQGSGGNIVASVGDDGTFIVDDQYAPLSEKITAALAKLSDQPTRFVINTHWHGDHTGGNENFGKSGAVIIAHENVRQRMSTEQFMAVFKSTVPAAPKAALPVVTFADEIGLHVNGTVQVIHVAAAHTDGDALVFFKDANVLHMGDTYFNGLYPFIDTGSGGSIRGVIAALDRALGIVDADTIVVPGHGPLSNQATLQGYRDMLHTFLQRIEALKADGKALPDVIKAKPTAEFDEAWGKQFIPPAALIESIYTSL